jgi:hypothetical protein
MRNQWMPCGASVAQARKVDCLGHWTRMVLAVCLLGGTRLCAADEEDLRSVPAAPRAEFTITITDNPSTGYTVALKSMSEGIFLLSTEPVRPPAQPRPGAASTRTFRFYNSLDIGGGDPPLVTFARFRVFDFANSYVEESYAVDISAAAAEPPTRLGVTCQADQRGGIRVTTVAPGSLAAALGLQRGDLVGRINGDQIRDIPDIRDALAKTANLVRVGLVRNGQSLDLDAPWPLGAP